MLIIKGQSMGKSSTVSTAAEASGRRRRKQSPPALVVHDFEDLEIGQDSIIEDASTETKLSRWGIVDNKHYGVSSSSSTLSAGLYTCRYSDNIGYYLQSQKISIDELLQLPDNASEEVIAEIEHFSNMKDKFTDYGFLYKRGVMLWGPPGSGKTSTIQLLINLFVKKMNGIVVQVQDPNSASEAMNMIRRIEPTRQILAIMEDIDSLVQDHGESGYLSLLDGENQINNVVFVATTNYPQRLDKRFKNRPSRFDTIKYIGMPSAPAREAYLLAKMADVTAEDLAEYVAKSEGYSVAHLKELVILTKCFEYSITDAIARLDDMVKRMPTSDSPPDKKSKFGFSSEDPDDFYASDDDDYDDCKVDAPDGDGDCQGGGMSYIDQSNTQ